MYKTEYMFKRYHFVIDLKFLNIYTTLDF